MSKVARLWVFMGTVAGFALWVVGVVVSIIVGNRDALGMLIAIPTFSLVVVMLLLLIIGGIVNFWDWVNRGN